MRQRRGAVFYTRNIGGAGLAVPVNNAQAHWDHTAEALSVAFAPRGPPVTRPSVDQLDLNIVTAPETNSSTRSDLTDSSSSHAGVVGYQLITCTTAPFALYGGDSMGSPAVHTATTMTGGE